MELSIVQQKERENEKRLKLLDITEIIDLYFSTFNYLLYSLRFLLSNKIDSFEKNLKSADFTVSIESLCMRLEIELLKNPNEYNEKLFNIISIRINDFERQLSNDTSSADFEYEKLKSTKIKFQVEYYQNLNTANFNFVYDAIQNERGTIETFCNAILNHFNYGKERINNLFSLKKLSIINNTLSQQVPLQEKQIEPIEWDNDIKELAYLFWKLRNENIIKIENLGNTLSKIFIDKNLESVKNTQFNKHLSDFSNNNTFPKNAKNIDAFISSIKKHQ